MRLSIQTNFPDVQRALDVVRREVAERALARSLNRAIEQARTQMGREIRSQYMVDSRFIRERLRIKRASLFGGVLSLEAVLEAQEKPRSANLIRFGARQTAEGVSVKIKRAGARRLVRGAFIGNKGRTVFERVPNTRMGSRKWGKQHGQKIKPVQTIDVPQMFNARRIKAAVVNAMQQRFPAIFQRELAFALTQFNR